jgi:CO/xanthine dehydrogenase Mo-binding subunit
MTKTPPDVEAEIVAAREAGWTIPAIAQRTGKSIATVKRIATKHKIKPGQDRDELITAARRELVEALSNNDRVRAIYGAVITDTLAQVEQAREKASEAVALLEPTDTKSAALTLRGLAAHSVATKNHADTLRALLPALQTDQAALPTLRVETLTTEAIEEMRRQQREEEAVLNGSASNIMQDDDLTDDDDLVEEQAA